MRKRSVILLVLFLVFSGFIVYSVDGFSSTSGSDSYTHANGSCKKYYWRCDNGQCIDEVRKCDGVVNCDDGSDESNEKCDSNYCDLETHFFCSSGECIDRGMVCDEAVHCHNEEDEEHCNEGETCPEEKFRCENGRCIPARWKCDGKVDCRNGSDERNCSKQEACPKGYTPCKNSKCIPINFLCDGKLDCEADEDEEGCGNYNETCLLKYGRFLCTDGKRCLKEQWICDGYPHCNDRSDEGGDCGIHCNPRTKVCHQTCFNTPLGPKCTCTKGYELLGDNTTCQDIDECKNDEQVCDHFCENTNGSFKCTCAPDYKLLDKATCRIKEPALLLFSVGKGIEAKSLDNSGFWIVWDGNMKTTGVAYDPKDDYVYWIANNEKIFYKTLHGKDQPKIFIHQGLEHPENLAVDWFGRNLYVADYNKNHILACNLKTEDCLPILKNLSKPRALQLDLHNKYLYWTAVKSSTIERSGLDGSERKTIIEEDIVWPNGLAIDHPALRIYWADAKLAQIDSSNYDGKERKSLPNKIASHAYSLAVWQDRIYWTDLQEGLHTEIHSCRKRDGMDWEPEYKSEKKAVNNLAIYHPSMFKHASNPCDRPHDLKCTHLCLLSPSSKLGYTCACPEEMELAHNGHACHEKETRIPMIAVQSKLYGVPLRNYGISNPILRKYARLDLGLISDMDYNPLKNVIYFADPKNKLVSAVNLSTRKFYKVIEKVEQPISVAIDWLRDNLYWVNGLHRTVEVTRSSGHYRLTVVKHLSNPIDLALDVVDGYLFISDGSLLPSIVKCELNGTNCVDVVRDNIMKPSSLCIDTTVEPKKLYWTDSEKNEIESIDVLGRNRTVVFKYLQNPMKVYVSEENIFWSERRSNYLNVASKTGNGAVAKINIELESVPTDEWFMSITVVGSKVKQDSDPCFSNEKCTQFCFSKTEKDKTCGCAQGLVLDADRSTCTVTKCDNHQNKCEDGECISSMFWCDGSVDCGDSSDEKNCTSLKKCTEEEFQCENGHCINLIYKCDGKHDCSDNSDEDPSYCPKIKECSSAEEWKCVSGECIPLVWRCNEKIDCEDGSDENCTHASCSNDKIRCDNGWCIPYHWLCDDNEDCPNGEDEKECPCKLTEYKCENGSCLDKAKLCSGELSCGKEQLNLTCSPGLTFPKGWLSETCPTNLLPCNASSAESQCVPFLAWCNGTSECSNGQDEKDCQKTCSEDKEKCLGEDSCIPKKWICDGAEDCSDGSDEVGCQASKPTTPKPTCSSDEFECPNGDCIHYSKVCNNRLDCVNGADEGENCDKCKKNKGGCEQICTNDPVKVICSCEEGYKLASDGTSCYDIDECENENLCHHLCENRRGKFLCKCKENYNLMKDGITCKPTGGQQWSIAIITEGKLLYLNEQLKRTSNPQKVPQYLKINHLIYDPSGKKLLGVDGENGILYKEGSSGNWTKEFSNLGKITATALDYINKNMYFAKSTENAYTSKRSVESKYPDSVMKVYNFESKYFGYLFTVHHKKISAMKFSIVSRIMITCENDDMKGSLVARNMDGSHPIILTDRKMLVCESLALDEIKERVYWLDVALNKIESVNFSGYKRLKFSSTEIHESKGLALLNQKLLWINMERHALVECSIKNPNECSEFYCGKGASFVNIRPMYSTSLHTPCANSNCQQICVPQSLGVHRCICADGFSFEGGNCVALPKPGDGAVAGDCAESPCNTGECESASLGYIVCRCPDGYRGKYCEISVEETKKDDTGKVVVVLIVVFLVIGVLLGCFICYKRRNGKLWNRDSPYARFRFINPSFVLMREETTTTQPPTPTLPRYATTDPTMERQTSQNSNDSAIVTDPLISSEVQDFDYEEVPRLQPTRPQFVSQKATVDPFLT